MTDNFVIVFVNEYVIVLNEITFNSALVIFICKCFPRLLFIQSRLIFIQFPITTESEMTWIASVPKYYKITSTSIIAIIVFNVVSGESVVMVNSHENEARLDEK